jgi:hypothetical protein
MDMQGTSEVATIMTRTATPKDGSERHTQNRTQEPVSAGMAAENRGNWTAML